MNFQINYKVGKEKFKQFKLGVWNISFNILQIGKQNM